MAPHEMTEEDLLELELAKQASREACIADIAEHLDDFIANRDEASYEEWILELHPESERPEDAAGSSIDYRYYLEDSDHRQLWNDRVGGDYTVPARDPPGAPAPPPFASPLPAFANGAGAAWQRMPFAAMTNMRPRPYQAPKDNVYSAPRSWIPLPPQGISTHSYVAPVQPPVQVRSWVAPIQVPADAAVPPPGQRFASRSYIAPVEPMSGSMSAAAAASAWLPTSRGVIDPLSATMSAMPTAAWPTQPRSTAVVSTTRGGGSYISPIDPLSATMSAASASTWLPPPSTVQLSAPPPPVPMRGSAVASAPVQTRPYQPPPGNVSVLDVSVRQLPQMVQQGPPLATQRQLPQAQPQSAAVQKHHNHYTGPKASAWPVSSRTSVCIPQSQHLSNPGGTAWRAPAGRAYVR